MRTAILLVMLGGAGLLLYWNRTNDPRFYRFVETDAGRVMARAFQWYADDLDRPIESKPSEKMTDDERAVLAGLEEDVRRDWPTHRLVFEMGQPLLGKVLEDHPDHVVFVQTYGVSGAASARIPKRRIKRIEPVTNAPPDVSYRDVRFKMENPALHYYRRPPYSILTDESFFRVEHTVTVLQELHRQFMAAFGGLVQTDEIGAGIQVLFFGREEAFREYRERWAPSLAGSSGFYSPRIDRLVVYNQGASERIDALRRDAKRKYDEFISEHPQPDARENADRWREETDRQIAGWAEAQTLSTIRHEGAHQLFFTLGVHSSHGAEGEWLMEGLATYCETPEIGARDSARVRVLRETVASNDLISIEKLINAREPDEGFSSYQGDGQRELAYCASWAMAQFLMQDDYRAGFFDYIRRVRDPKHHREVRETEPLDLLARSIGLSSGELIDRWTVFVSRL